MTETTSTQQHVSAEAILLTRTDRRGVITSANSAFIAISGYDADELLKAPHKIVRHDDMPKGVFHLMWTELLAGRATGAYVKNRCKNGDFYWVFAAITPINDGFLSVRTAAVPEEVKAISAIYANLREREESGLTPEESADALRALLSEDGYQSYEQFLAKQSVVQHKTRTSALDRQSNERLGHLADIKSDWVDIEKECKALVLGYNAFKIAPVNMRIQAGHMGDDGIALDVIAANFAGIADEVNRDLTKYIATVSNVAGFLDRCRFLCAMELLLREANVSLSEENLMTNDDVAQFKAQKDRFETDVQDCLSEITRELARFIDGSARIKRNLSGLSMTKVMCAIENTKTPENQASSVGAIIAELGHFQEQTEERLRAIGTKLTAIEDSVGQISQRKTVELAEAS